MKFDFDVSFINFVDMFLGVLDCKVAKIGFEKVYKTKKISSKFYILFNDIQNFINKFYQKIEYFCSLTF